MAFKMSDFKALYTWDRCRFLLIALAVKSENTTIKVGS
jgi:hypothetical protein